MGNQIELPNLPIEKWLSPKEVAGHFGLSAFSTYRWINEGLIPQEFVRNCGMWRYRLHPKVIEHLQEKFATAHA
jgi:predicted site-specific integrase-resolvase